MPLSFYVLSSFSLSFSAVSFVDGNMLIRRLLWCEKCFHCSFTKYLHFNTAEKPTWSSHSTLFFLNRKTQVLFSFFFNSNISTKRIDFSAFQLTQLHGQRKPSKWTTVTSFSETTQSDTKQKGFQKWFEEHTTASLECWLGLKILQTEHLWGSYWINKSDARQGSVTRFKGSAAKVLTPETTAHIQGFVPPGLRAIRVVVIILCQLDENVQRLNQCVWLAESIWSIKNRLSFTHRSPSVFYVFFAWSD